MTVPPAQNRSVLVTGCSSGIGAAAAPYLRDRGWRVFPSARKLDDVARLRDAGFDAVRLDVADSTSIREAVATLLEATGGQLGAVVNNAGYGQPGAVEDVPREALRRQFEVNVFGAHELTATLVPVFRRQGWGRIVTVSSVLGRVTIPMVGSYCATKHALESLSDALRVELRGSGVAVSLVEPGPIATRFRTNAVAMGEEHLDADSRFAAEYRREHAKRTRADRRDTMFTRPPEAVAARIAHALASPHPRRRYCVTVPAYLGAILRRVVPDALLDYIGARRLRKTAAGAT